MVHKPEPNHDPFPGFYYAKADLLDNTDRAVGVAEAVHRWLRAIESRSEEE